MIFKFLKYLSLALLLCLTFNLLGYAQWNRARKDGLWWVAIGPDLKENYLIGYMSGMNLGKDLTIEKYPKSSKCRKTAESLFSNVYQSMLKIRIDSLIQGVDSLYKDTNNLAILAGKSFWIVTNQMAGMNPEYIKNLIINIKNDDTKNFKSLQELKEYKLPY